MFTSKQLSSMEEYFEGWDDDEDPWRTKNNLTPKKALTAIMKNVITNNGTFKPSQLKGY